MLSTKQIRQFRAKAHKLNPVVTIGDNGLSRTVQQEIEQALEAHELIKIRVNIKDKDFKQLLAEQIQGSHQAELVQIIGHILVLYRKKSPKH